MIVLSNSLQQEVPVGQAIVFDVTVVRSRKCTECHRRNTGSVKMTRRCDYDVHFHGNIGGEAANVPVELTIALGGEPMRETTMVSVPAYGGNLNNVSAETGVVNCCGDYSRLTVVNTGTVPVTVGPNTCFKISCCES